MSALAMTKDTDLDGNPLPTAPQREALDARLEEARRFLQNGVRRNNPGNFEIPRVIFDPSNKEHLRSYKTFLETGKWGDIQFHLELPLTSVTETVHRKFSAYALEQLLKAK